MRGSGWALGALSSCAGRVPHSLPRLGQVLRWQASGKQVPECLQSWLESPGLARRGVDCGPAEGGLGEARGQDVPVVRVGRLEPLCCQGDGGRFPSSLAFSFVVKCT